MHSERFLVAIVEAIVCIFFAARLRTKGRIHLLRPMVLCLLRRPRQEAVPSSIKRNDPWLQTNQLIQPCLQYPPHRDHHEVLYRLRDAKHHAAPHDYHGSSDCRHV